MVLTAPAERPAFSGNLHKLSFEQLHKKFKRDIERLASTFPKAWKDDFCQEGAIALFDASQKFIILPKDRDFRPYALKAIKRRMIDFNRKAIERHPITEYASITHDDFGEEELIYNFSNESDLAASFALGLDYQTIFSAENLRARGFSTGEIEAFRLHFERDLTVTDVAAALRISIGQASKMIAKLRSKTQELFNEINK